MKMLVQPNDQNETGDTEINLAIFDSPRLSVDIVLDFMRSTTRKEIPKNREIISEHIKNSRKQMDIISTKDQGDTMQWIHSCLVTETLWEYRQHKN